MTPPLRDRMTGHLLVFALLVVATPVRADNDNGATTDASKEGGTLVDQAHAADIRNLWENEPILGAGLSLYKPNYLLPVTWADEAETGADAEAQFQLSLKQRVGNSHVFLAYTQTSFWRLYDSDDSRPFRETNFKPEIFYRWRAEKNPLGPIDLDIGLEHQSNGESQPNSRSWHRAYLRPIYRTRDWQVTLQLWARVFAPDDPSTVEDPDGDDNPDMVDFMGNHELEIDWRFAEGRQLSLMNRYNFDEGNGALRLRYSEPTNAEGFHWYVQLFHGYGESLIDYNREISRIGIGFAISR
ncbi:MAG: phospholipase A [Halofilum sp. (in: g-proteobacteria)]|nr:phospholipase A [Halofilum sp. (in: g-proteobacteria)]